MKFKKFGKLPGQPSKLIRLALSDLKKVERSKKYVVDMENWHLPIKGKCHVCLAGSVISKSLVGKPFEGLSPSFFNIKVKHALMAIDAFRKGECCDAFFLLSLDFSVGYSFTRNIIEYELNKKLFHEQLHKLADDLEEAGY